MEHWIRIFGSFLIALGFAILVGSIYGALAFYVVSLIFAKDYVAAIILISLTLVATGFSLRKIFKEPKK